MQLMFKYVMPNGIVMHFVVSRTAEIMKKPTYLQVAVLGNISNTLYLKYVLEIFLSIFVFSFEILLGNLFLIFILNTFEK